MTIKELALINFKNYTENTFRFSSDINCFVGNNGEGKTNLLDAIHYLSITKSYFNSIDSQNIKHNENYCLIQGKYQNKNENDIDILSCVIEKNKKKRFKKNNKEYKKISEHIGKYPIVMTTPDDIDLITGSSEIRRRFLDMLIAQYNPKYLHDLMAYNKALIHRNKLLKQADTAPKSIWNESLELIDDKLVNEGNKVFLQRKKFISAYTPIFNNYFEQISPEKEIVNIAYESVLHNNDFYKLLKQNLKKDSLLQHTSKGIHRDDIDLLLYDYSIKKTGSQGQKKSLLLALKFAKYDFIAQKTNKKPILLLDDIFDKLDNNRVKNIIALVNKNDFGQIFITDTNEDRITDILNQIGVNYKLFYIEKATIKNEYTKKF